jgi:POT family proton-dependent oligopeptide transporter
MGLGTGGFKPNISPLVVEQIHFGQYTISTLPSGERVIIDPVITQSRVYHYYYLFVNIGALVGQIGMSYAEKYVGFWLAFTLPTAIFLICPAIMAWGKKRYTQAKPQGSVLSKAMRILMFAQKGRWSINPVRTWKNMHDGTFWESVKPSNIAPANRPSWMTFDDQWVDEVARGFAACAVFAWYPLYWITYNQLNNNLTAQADTMILNGIPNDVLSNLDPFALIILIPICDSFIYPALRKYGIRFTPIRKIAAGFFTGTAGMIWAAVLQYYIYQRSPCGNQANTCTDDDGNSLVADINVWAQTGAYVLIAVSEIFASITSLEYAFSKAPKNMRSLVQAVALFTSAISSAIGEALNPLSEDPLLVWNYGTMAVLSFVGGILFYIQFRGLDAEEEELNMLPEGHVVAVKTLDDEVDMPRPIADEIKI